MRRTIATVILSLGFMVAAAPSASASVEDPSIWPDTRPFVEVATIPTDCSTMYFSAVDLFDQFKASLNWEEDQRESLSMQLENAQQGIDSLGNDLERTAHRNATRVHRLRHTVSQQRREIRELRAQVRALRAN